MMQNILFVQQIFLKDTPGKGIAFFKMNDHEVAVINLQGRTFMPPFDCPFKKADELVEEAQETNTDYLC